MMAPTESSLRKLAVVRSRRIAEEWLLTTQTGNSRFPELGKNECCNPKRSFYTKPASLKRFTILSHFFLSSFLPAKANHSFFAFIIHKGTIFLKTVLIEIWLFSAYCHSSRIASTFSCNRSSNLTSGIATFKILHFIQFPMLAPTRVPINARPTIRQFLGTRQKINFTFLMRGAKWYFALARLKCHLSPHNHYGISTIGSVSTFPFIRTTHSYTPSVGAHGNAPLRHTKE